MHKFLTIKKYLPIKTFFVLDLSIAQWRKVTTKLAVSVK